MAEATTSVPASNTPATAQAAPGAPTDAVQNAPATQAAKAEAARMFKLKVDGQDLELPESEIIALAQQGKAANKRFQEASVTRRDAEQIIQFAKDNPTEFFKRTGMNARQWAEDFLMGEIKREQMTPEQRAAAQAQEELKTYKEREKKAAETAKQAKDNAATQAQMKVYDDKFVKALAETNLPKTPFTVKRMAELEMACLKKGIEVPPSELAKLVKEDFAKEQTSLSGGLEGDALLSYLGPDVVKKVQRAILAKHKAKTPAPQAARSTRTEAKGENRVQSWKEFTKKTRSL